MREVVDSLENGPSIETGVEIFCAKLDESGIKPTCASGRTRPQLIQARRAHHFTAAWTATSTDGHLTQHSIYTTDLSIFA